MNRRSPILEKLADLYAASPLGETGVGRFTRRFEDLIAAAGCERGDAYANAIADLREGERLGMLELACSRSHDIQLVRVPVAMEAALFSWQGRMSPTAEREAWAELFKDASSWTVPNAYAVEWAAFCARRAEQALSGKGWKPFRKIHRQRALKQLEVLARLLGWTHPALLRTVSVQVAESSKFLERSRGTLQALLAEVTQGAKTTFEDLAISDTPREVRFFGPVQVKLRGEWRDYAPNAGASSLSEDDLSIAEAVQFSAPRCVTVENGTKFHELCRLGCGDVFVFTSYPNRATAEFLRRVPVSLPMYHFGDTDPWGFDVLRALRKALGRPILALHMRYRLREGSPVLGKRDRAKLGKLLGDPLLADVRDELHRMDDAGQKGDFEQEGLLVKGVFPYLA